ncbi:MAG: HD domain-containing protein [Clostridia bacterium]|nr:HD domain-containing protein [Clostridia bacterium]
MNIIEECKEYVKNILENESSGHDYWHTIRVFNLATTIQKIDGGNLKIIQLSALLHDVDDYKIFGENAKTLQNANKFLNENNVSEEEIKHINNIINSISFKGIDTKIPETIEGKIVQDADRLDAIGAIGIARTFAYGGNKGRTIHIPNCKYKENMTKEEYEKNESTTINHFYEKLLLLEDMMNTSYAKELAHKRTEYMKEFLNEFYNEWDGNI